MTTKHDELIHKLLKLAQWSDKGKSLPPVEQLSARYQRTDSAIELDRLPRDLAQNLHNILETFDQVKMESECLADELLAFYDHLNLAFDAISAMARCHSTRQAVKVLAEKIAHAVNSNFGYYLGSLIDRFSLLEEENNNHKDNNIFYSPEKPPEPKIARDFFTRHEAALREMTEEKVTCQVKMIDYQVTYNPNYEGHGNVLAVKLNSNESDLNDLGRLIFVRTDQQPPFIAVEMNLADSLARMGSAVLGNIIYTQKLNQAYLQAIASLVRAMEAKDSYTSGHSSRVAQTACELAHHIGIDDDQIQILEWAGMMHDIGKIGIRDNVLHKPGKLTKEEFDHIKTHPVQSYKVLEPIEALRCILPTVKHHHEHYDGSGYPDGLAGQGIPYLARILQIADVWDALTSTRSYRNAMSADEAINIIRSEAGTTMDPTLVKCFLEIIK